MIFQTETMRVAFKRNHKSTAFFLLVFYLLLGLEGSDFYPDRLIPGINFPFLYFFSDAFRQNHKKSVNILPRFG